MSPQTKHLLRSKGKHLLLLLVLVLAITFQAPIKDFVTPEKPISKTVEIEMYAKTDYSLDVYKDSKAKVEVTISKYRNEKFEVLYNTTLEAGNLSKLPSAENAYKKALTVNNFYQHKDLLVATYTVSYESKGAILKYDKHILIPENKGKSALALSI